jgi:uncharacterized protein
MRCIVPHRWLAALSLTALLYGASTAFASEAGSAQTFAAPRPEVPAALPIDSRPAPHIALILPVKSDAFARAAAAVRDGFYSAAKVQGHAPLPIRDYPVSEESEEVLAAYQQALAADARLVVGPLTRSGVTALATGDLALVPTLALNVPDGNVALPPKLYSLSLHVESEARQAAQRALKEGRLSAITVVGDTPLLRRIHQAFVGEFTRGGGRLVAEFAFSPDPDALGRLKQEAMLGNADMAFLALDLQRSRLARPYLDPLFLYATSQVNPGDTGPLVGFDLAGVRFLDMPWLLQYDHPAVMIYPRQAFGGALDLERLYALGIDAFRVAQTLLSGTAESALDGVTGRIKLGDDRRFVRELAAAQFSGGKLVVQESTRP